LWVIKRSHLLDTKIRGSGILMPDYYQVKDLIEKHKYPVNVKRGEAVLFYHNTLHGSFPNTTNKRRVICSFSVIPKTAPFRLYFQNKPNTNLELYEPPDDYWFDYEDLLSAVNSPPANLSPIKTFPPLEKQIITVKQFENVIKSEE
jgi:hypothetical protein